MGNARLRLLPSCSLIGTWGRIRGPTERPFLDFCQFRTINSFVRSDVDAASHNASIHFLRAQSFSMRIEFLPCVFAPRHHRERKFHGEVCASERRNWDFVCLQVLLQPGTTFFGNRKRAFSLALIKALPSDGNYFKSARPKFHQIRLRPDETPTAEHLAKFVCCVLKSLFLRIVFGIMPLERCQVLVIDYRTCRIGALCLSFEASFCR